MNILKRQYGLFVSICIVVGFIVGTGIFWRPGRVLYEAGGNMWLGVLAWVVRRTNYCHMCLYVCSNGVKI